MYGTVILTVFHPNFLLNRNYFFNIIELRIFGGISTQRASHMRWCVHYRPIQPTSLAAGL